ACFPVASAPRNQRNAGRNHESHGQVMKTPKRSLSLVDAWLFFTWAWVNASRHATPPSARYRPPPSPSPALPPLPVAPPAASLPVTVLVKIVRADWPSL